LEESPVKALVCGITSLALALSACSSNDDSGEDDGVLEAPMLTMVEPMEGALHLTWMNMQSDCDSVDAERKMNGAEYAAAFSVPGSVDNEMDESATEDMTYSYRLRCKKGSEYSEYSNEMSANPHHTSGH
jgi:hypothetical protein